MIPMPSAGPSPDVEAALRETLAEDADAFPGTGLDLAGRARAGVRRRHRRTLLVTATALVLAVPAGWLSWQQLDTTAPQRPAQAFVSSPRPTPPLDPRCRAQAATLSGPAIRWQRLPADARVTEVLRCGVKFENRNGELWRVAVQERATEGLAGLVAILKTPDRPIPPGTVCTLLTTTSSPIWARLDDGRWLPVLWPQAGCNPIFVGRDVYAGVHFVTEREEPVAAAAVATVDPPGPKKP